MIDQPSSFNLKRYPKTSDNSLKAWSAADELIIHYLNDNQPEKNSKILIINDQFGALTVSLNQYPILYWVDSYLSNKAIKQNLDKNEQQLNQNNHFAQIERLPITLTKTGNLSFTEISHLKQSIDLVIVRIPKHNSLLEYQLEQIKPLLKTNSLIIGAGMTKDIHKTNLQIFENAMGPTKTSLAVKKARLIFSQYKNTARQPCRMKSYTTENNLLNVYGLPGVFSREKLDIGAKVLLDHLPSLLPDDQVIDIGCGNGIIGATLAIKYPKTTIHLTDESALSIDSAKITFDNNKLSNGLFYVTDVIENTKIPPATHILCNPPFHQQNVQTLSIANKMFKLSASKLKPNGELRVVANRHLRYASMLKRYFHSVKSISANNKFTVWLATQPIKNQANKKTLNSK